MDLSGIKSLLLTALLNSYIDFVLFLLLFFIILCSWILALHAQTVHMQAKVSDSGFWGKDDISGTRKFKKYLQSSNWDWKWQKKKKKRVESSSADELQMTSLQQKHISSLSGLNCSTDLHLLHSKIVYMKGTLPLCNNGRCHMTLIRDVYFHSHLIIQSLPHGTLELDCMRYRLFQQEGILNICENWDIQLKKLREKSSKAKGVITTNVNHLFGHKITCRYKKL